MRNFLSLIGATCLILGAVACESKPKAPKGTEPATREMAEEFEHAARRACSVTMDCLEPSQQGELDRVTRASHTFPEYGRICLDEVKAASRLKPAGRVCMEAATAHMGCREMLPCSANWQEECVAERTALRNACHDFIGSSYPPQAN